MIEYLAPGFVYSLVKDAWSKIRPKRRVLTPAQIVESRQKWKAEVEPWIVENCRKKLRHDVIIRDMKRIDRYPETSDEQGISPWFRGALVGTYHRGVQIGLTWAELTMHSDGESYRRTNYDAGEKGDINTLLIGLIPYENIENIDWDGDEYYNYPHLYCYFLRQRREPYERLAYFTEIVPSHGIPHYSEVADYEAVRKLTKKYSKK